MYDISTLYNNMTVISCLCFYMKYCTSADRSGFLLQLTRKFVPLQFVIVLGVLQKLIFNTLGSRDVFPCIGMMGSSVRAASKSFVGFGFTG